MNWNQQKEFFYSIYFLLVEDFFLFLAWGFGVGVIRNKVEGNEMELVRVL